MAIAPPPLTWLTLMLVPLCFTGSGLSAAFPSPRKTCPPKHQGFLDILHFNDISDVMKTPFFAHEYLKRSTPQTLRLFSGDVFFPSFLSNILKGKQFLHFLKKIKPDFSVVGNHELDYGEDNFMELKRALSIKWLLANFKRKGTNINVGEAADHGSITLGGLKVCVFGLADRSWVESLVIDASQYEFEDFLTKARTISKSLRDAGCDMVIALTHMDDNSDLTLLRDAQSDIDLILGGHHHIYRISRFGQRLMIKSGENFDHFSHIKISTSKKALNNQTQNSSSDPNFDFILRLSASEVLKEKKQQFFFSLKRDDDDFFNVSIEKIPVNLRTGRRDLELYFYNQRNFAKYYDQLKSPILKFTDDVDIRSDAISRGESPVGHFLTDVIRASYGLDLAGLSMGIVRSENIYYKTDILREHDAHSMFSIPLNIKFSTLPGIYLKNLLDFALQAFLGGVDNFEVSGVTYNYNPTKPNPADFIDLTTLKIGGENFNPGKLYTLMIPNPTSILKETYPLLAALPLSDYNGIPITMIDIFTNFCFLPRDADNRTEFALFKSSFPSMSINELNEIGRSNAQPKVNPRLTQGLLDSVGKDNVLATLTQEAVTRLRLYTLAGEIINVESTYIFQVTPYFQKRLNMVV
jgi:2',3'-cyclic-nucleotide 2'-phosphodiesterase (5'-nucleotidase family)